MQCSACTWHSVETFTWNRKKETLAAFTNKFIRDSYLFRAGWTVAMSGKAWRPYVRVGSSKREKRNFTAYLDQFREPYSPSPRRTGRRNKPKRKILKTMGQGKKAKPKEKDTSEKLVGDGSQVNSVPVNDSTSRPVLKTMGQDKKAKSKEKDTSEKLVVDGSQINSVPLDVSTSKTVVVIMDGVADISMRQGGIFKSNLDKLLSSNSVTGFRMNEFIDIYSRPRLQCTYLLVALTRK